jgi:hypothetical protein
MTEGITKNVEQADFSNAAKQVKATNLDSNSTQDRPMPLDTPVRNG